MCHCTLTWTTEQDLVSEKKNQKTTTLSNKVNYLNNQINDGVVGKIHGMSEIFREKLIGKGTFLESKVATKIKVPKRKWTYKHVLWLRSLKYLTESGGLCEEPEDKAGKKVAVGFEGLGDLNFYPIRLEETEFWGVEK